MPANGGAGSRASRLAAPNRAAPNASRMPAEAPTRTDAKSRRAPGQITSFEKGPLTTPLYSPKRTLQGPQSVTTTSTTARGVILQATYRVESKQPGGRRVPVVHLYGRLEDGGTFLVRDDRQLPHFFIRTEDIQRARDASALPLNREPSSTAKHTFDGSPVAEITVGVPSDVPAIRDRLHQAGIDTFEADVRFPVRYLIERDIKGSCEIEGVATPGEGVTVIFDNPKLRPTQLKIEPRVLSFDIETDPKAERLLAISLYAPGVDEVLIVDGSGRPMPDRATACEDEHKALTAFCDRIREFDPDVITGWNTIDFDFTVLQRAIWRSLPCPKTPFNSPAVQSSPT